ncbi:hypothetical protein [Evansella clarkii]|uniref:hypothetical protein n=1 Tax=Evansella clarkii TaxID=79879 RepID=UPI001F42810B|nr:hypothetical protein [Evansella clarkii]
MASMYSMWMPLPLVFNEAMDSEFIQAGTIFGFAYLIMLIITMTLQTGHIVYIVKHNEENLISDKHGEYMMATLSNPFEGLANVFKSVWALFLAISFWDIGEVVMAILMALFSLLLIYYLFIMLDTSLVKRVKLLSKVKPNPFIINIETLIFFVILTSYLTFIM